MTNKRYIRKHGFRAKGSEIISRRMAAGRLRLTKRASKNKCKFL